MPRGTWHELTGVLERGPMGLRLYTDGGGYWEIDAGRRAWRFENRRVRVTGRRSGFNWLDADTVEAL